MRKRAEQAKSAKKILVVDDNEHIRGIIAFILVQAGYEVAPAGDAIEASDRLREASPDLIVLDVMMPRIDGFSFCEHLQTKEETCRIPVLFLTAKSLPEDVMRGYLAGGNDHLTKPFKRDELLDRIRALIGASRQ